MADVEKVISVLLDEKNWETLTGIDGVPSFAMDAVVLLKSQQAEIERLTKTEEQKQAERKKKRLEWQAKYRESHRQQAYQTTKEWRKNNPDKVKAQRARYRERQRMRKDGDGDV